MKQITREPALSICRPSLPCQKHNVGWFLLRRLVDLIRVYSLHRIMTELQISYKVLLFDRYLPY